MINKLVKTLLPAKILKKFRAIYIRKIAMGSSRGGDVYCPCCGTNFSSFVNCQPNWERLNLDFFLNIRQDCICAKCQSKPRHRIVCDYLEKHKSPALFDNILIFAAGYCLEAYFTRNKIKYTTADLFVWHADVKADIQDIPFGDNTFSFISCDHVLECDMDYKLALRELFRVLKKGGVCAITVPLLPEMNITYEDKKVSAPDGYKQAYGWVDARRIFGMDFPMALQEAGFLVSIYDGDTCDEKILPITAPSKVDYNKVFVARKP